MNENLQMWSDSKKVLDVACGGRMFYFDKSDQRVLFVIIEPLRLSYVMGESSL